MKFLATVETVGLMFLALGNNIVGGKCWIFQIDKPILTFELIASSLIHREKHIAAYHPDAFQTVLNSASELFAIQVVGAATSLDQLKFLCQAASSLSSRLQSGNYNTTLIQTVICNAAGSKTLPSVDEIKTFTTEIATQLWIIQTIGAVQGKLGVKKLSHLINESAASSIGLVGPLAKTDVRAAAAVAEKVARSGQPAQVNLTALLDNSFAPVSKPILPFVPIKLPITHKGDFVNKSHPDHKPHFNSTKVA